MAYPNVPSATTAPPIAAQTVPANAVTATLNATYVVIAIPAPAAPPAPTPKVAFKKFTILFYSFSFTFESNPFK